MVRQRTDHGEDAMLPVTVVERATNGHARAAPCPVIALGVPTIVEHKDDTAPSAVGPGGSLGAGPA